MSSALERLKQAASPEEEDGHCVVCQADLLLMLAAISASQVRFDVWTRETYVALEAALQALTQESV